MAGLLRSQATTDTDQANAVQLSLEHVYSANTDDYAQANADLTSLVEKENTKLYEQLRSRTSEYSRHLKDSEILTEKILFNGKNNTTCKAKASLPSRAGTTKQEESDDEAGSNSDSDSGRTRLYQPLGPAKSTGACRSHDWTILTVSTIEEFG